MGNYEANSLTQCQLLRLRTLAQEIVRQESRKSNLLPNEDESSPLIWIDTLCCPVRPPEAKTLALQKMREVYQRAHRVLVLDASLQVLALQSMKTIEKLARVFTSGWMTRLWTLQEGALANSLFFQFADGAISMNTLRTEMLQMVTDLRGRIVMFDFLGQFQRIEAFFHGTELGTQESDLNILNSALQHRSVSVPSDEPLCMGTLMSLPMSEILHESVEKDDRMRVVWRLLADKQGGLPSKMIFFEDRRIEKPGWGWAPASLLNSSPGFYKTNTRMIGWKDPTLAQPTPHGLHVQFPGFRLKRNIISDGRPRNPWNEATRLSEADLVFRDTKNNQWVQVIDKRRAAQQNAWSEEGEAKYNMLQMYPMSDLLSKDDCFIICADDAPRRDGIIASFATPATTTSTLEILDGIPVHTQRHVLINSLTAANSLLYDAVEILARRMRDDEPTNNDLDTVEKRDGEDKDRLSALKDKMKDVMRDAIKGDAKLGEAIDECMGSKLRDWVWCMIGDWYYHDFVGEKMPDGQKWYVD